MTDHTDERPMDTTDDELDTDTENRPAAPDDGGSSLDPETPGSQGEIDSGSEGDFGRDEPRV